jgi:hypothetical protein
MNTTEDLVRTKVYLEEHGWCQRTYFGPSGSTCLRGALVGSGASWDTINFVDSHIPTASWNDAPGRTVSEVMEMLDQLIQESDEQHN